MKFYELLKKSDFSKIKPYLDDLFEKKYDDSKFKQFLFFLKNLNPEFSDLKIFIRLTKDEFSNESYYHVSGIDDAAIADYKSIYHQNDKDIDFEKIITYNISSVSRNILLGAELLNYENLLKEINNEHIIALCLFEFSYFGITSKKIIDNI